MTLMVSSVSLPGDRLNANESAKLEELEAIVEQGLKSFITVAKALSEIKEKKLYRELHRTFEAYVKARWDKGRQWAHQILAADAAAANIKASGLPSPVSERQIRPLVSLSPEVQVAAWEVATKSTPKPTEKEVRVAAQNVSRGLQNRPATIAKPQPDAPVSGVAEMKAEVERLKAGGFIPPNAEVYYTEGDGGTPAEVATEVAAELSDADWLATFDARQKLSDRIRHRFDAEAIAFRKATAARLKFVAALKPITNAAKKETAGHIGPWMSRISWGLRANGPLGWKPCFDCGGTGVEPLLGDCTTCKGHGYHIS